MIVTQIAATVFGLSAIVTFVAAMLVDFEKNSNWVDYVGMAAMAISAVSLLVSIFAFIWSL
jgi:hypothetical protein